MKNLEEFSVTFCTNGYMVSYSFENLNGTYESCKMVFRDTKELHDFIDSLIQGRITSGNTGI